MIRKNMVKYKTQIEKLLFNKKENGGETYD